MVCVTQTTTLLNQLRHFGENVAFTPYFTNFYAPPHPSPNANMPVEISSFQMWTFNVWKMQSFWREWDWWGHAWHQPELDQSWCACTAPLNQFFIIMSCWVKLLHMINNCQPKAKANAIVRQLYFQTVEGSKDKCIIKCGALVRNRQRKTSHPMSIWLKMNLYATLCHLVAFNHFMLAGLYHI